MPYASKTKAALLMSFEQLNSAVSLLLTYHHVMLQVLGLKQFTYLCNTLLRLRMYNTDAQSACMTYGSKPRCMLLLLSHATRLIYRIQWVELA